MTTREAAAAGTTPMRVLAPVMTACLTLLGCAADTADTADSPSTPSSSPNSPTSPTSPATGATAPSVAPSVDPGEAEEALPPITEPTGTVLDTTDRHGDVRQQGPDDETRMKLKPDERDGDITAVRIVHGTDHVYLRLDLAQLNKTRRDGTTGQQGTRYNYYVFLGLNRSPDATPRTRGWTLITGAGHRSGQTKLWFGDAGRNTYCDGVIGQFDYELAEVRISIPRECLEHPEWVQANIAFETYQYEPRYTYSEDHWPRYEDAEGGWSPRVYAP